MSAPSSSPVRLEGAVPTVRKRAALDEEYEKILACCRCADQWLFEDADTVEEWREKGFYPVLNEYGATPEANRSAGTMYRTLRLKEQNPLPAVRRLPESFDLSLNRKQFCAQSETFDRFSRKHPLWGMPYALPGLPAAEQEILMRWMEQGARYTPRAPVSPAFSGAIDRWEKFLNGNTLKERLASRYIFEHVYLAHLYFPEVDRGSFFRLVRSATPPGEPVELIATRRPYGDPGVDRVFYRLQPVLGTIVAKTHMPYRLDDQRMQRWKSLFIDEPYEVEQLPSYAEKDASNPFRTFDALPVRSRYRFMLDEAQFTIMGFIKGAVCRGQVALDVINDNFWVFFVDPELPQIELIEEFLASQDINLDLPAGNVDIYLPVTHWRKYKKQQKELLAERDRFLIDSLGSSEEITLDIIWDGGGLNDNAALTIFRHFDSATVEKGLLGQTPKTAWLIGYSLLERIHYLLVAGYDVYGNIGHQLVTRLYMDFLRMEGEANFMLLLPESARVRERGLWYQDVDDEIKAYVMLPGFEKVSNLAIEYSTNDEKRELFGMLARRLDKILPAEHTMPAIDDPGIRAELSRLHLLVGTPATLMPEIAFVRIESPSGDRYVTIVNNRAHSSMTSMFKEHKNRLPDEDTLSVIPGFIGTYPNVFYVVDENRLADFVDTVSAMETEDDYRDMLDAYGVRRTDPGFWANSDTFHRAYRQRYPLSSGILDFGRLENR